MLWIRAEERSTEHRTPIVPADAARLVGHGLDVVVEEAPHRVYPAAAYAEAGCRIVASGQWRSAPPEAYVVGLKELPETGEPLSHRHIYFGHCYKGQPSAGRLLRRFAAGGGELLDLEYLVDARGRRLAAFGYWAGYAGAALAVLHQRGALRTPLAPTSRAALDARLAEGADPDARLAGRAALDARLAERADPDARLAGRAALDARLAERAATGAQPEAGATALVVGALGRCGTGARDALARAGQAVTAWDLDETRVLDRPAVIGHDLLVNAVLTTGPAEPFVTAADVADPRRRLAVVADITCDVGSPHHTIPIYDTPTTWTEPVRRVAGEPAPLDVIAIDNLPSLLPRESSDAFSADLTPHLVTLDQPHSPWAACRARFRAATGATIGGER